MRNFSEIFRKDAAYDNIMISKKNQVFTHSLKNTFLENRLRAQIVGLREYEEKENELLKKNQMKKKIITRLFIKYIQKAKYFIEKCKYEEECYYIV